MRFIHAAAGAENAALLTTMLPVVSRVQPDMGRTDGYTIPKHSLFQGSYFNRPDVQIVCKWSNGDDAHYQEGEMHKMSALRSSTQESSSVCQRLVDCCQNSAASYTTWTGGQRSKSARLKSAVNYDCWQPREGQASCKAQLDACAQDDWCMTLVEFERFSSSSYLDAVEAPDGMFHASGISIRQWNRARNGELWYENETHVALNGSSTGELIAVGARAGEALRAARSMALAEAVLMGTTYLVPSGCFAHTSADSASAPASAPVV